MKPRFFRNNSISKTANIFNYTEKFNSKDRTYETLDPHKTNKLSFAP